MHGDVALFLLLLVLGCAAFFFGVVYLIGRAIAWVAGGLLSLFGGGRRACCDRARRTGDPRSQGRVCPRGDCRRVEYRIGARYCSQCGERLT